MRAEAPPGSGNLDETLQNFWKYVKDQEKKSKNISISQHQELADLPADWLNFDPGKMTLSDGYHEKIEASKQNLTDIDHRDIR